jgi:hypothetical protein
MADGGRALHGGQSAAVDPLLKQKRPPSWAAFAIQNLDRFYSSSSASTAFSRSSLETSFSVTVACSAT